MLTDVFLFASQIQIDMSSSSTRDVWLRAEVLPESPSPLIELEEKDPVGDTQLMDSDTQTWAEGMKRDAMSSCFYASFGLFFKHSLQEFMLGRKMICIDSERNSDDSWCILVPSNCYSSVSRHPLVLVQAI